MKNINGVCYDSIDDIIINSFEVCCIQKRRDEAMEYIGDYSSAVAHLEREIVCTVRELSQSNDQVKQSRYLIKNINI